MTCARPLPGIPHASCCRGGDAIIEMFARRYGFWEYFWGNQSLVSPARYRRMTNVYTKANGESRQVVVECGDGWSNPSIVQTQSAGFGPPFTFATIIDFESPTFLRKKDSLGTTIETVEIADRVDPSVFIGEAFNAFAALNDFPAAQTGQTFRVADRHYGMFGSFAGTFLFENIYGDFGGATEAPPPECGYFLNRAYADFFLNFPGAGLSDWTMPVHTVELRKWRLGNQPAAIVTKRGGSNLQNPVELDCQRNPPLVNLVLPPPTQFLLVGDQVSPAGQFRTVTYPLPLWPGVSATCYP